MLLFSTISVITNEQSYMSLLMLLSNRFRYLAWEKSKHMSETESSLVEKRLTAILMTLPVPVHMYYEKEKQLYYWECPPYGKGTALLFEDALAHALSCTQNALLPEVATKSTSPAKEPLSISIAPGYVPDKETPVEPKTTIPGERRQGKLLQLFKHENKRTSPDTALIRLKLAFATFVATTYSSAVLSMLLHSWWTLALGLFAGTILSALTTAFIENDKWAGDQIVMIAWTFLIFTPLWGYIGWLLATIVCQTMFPFLPSVAVIVGNILGLLVGLAVGLLGYVVVVVIITGKQFNGKE